MHGLNRNTGEKIEGLAHLQQSLGDIFTTWKGSRVMRRDYGCDLNGIIDAPMTRENTIEFFATLAEAIDADEPRIELTRVSIDEAEAGRCRVTLGGNWFYRWPENVSQYVEVVL